MSDLPGGTVTFLFSDIEGSTALLRHTGEQKYRELLDTHRDIVRSAIAANDGREVGTEGDSFFVAFGRPRDAVAAALDIQLNLHEHPWPDGANIRVRIGIHTGEASASGGVYVGMAVNEAARIASAANGGQVIVSETTRVLTLEDLPEGARMLDIGTHELKDIAAPVRLFQLEHTRLPADTRPPRTNEAHPNNLPADLSAFIGRDTEVAAAHELLDANRLVTMTGAGGCGKTRLALHVAGGRLDPHPDGVWFVDLAPLRDPDGVVPALATVLDLPSTEDGLRNALRQRTLLLVLDNCEHVIDAAAKLADALLRACPGLSLLATSREPLGVAGEATMRVPSLHGAEAEGLFAQRAKLAKPAIDLNAHAAAITEICRRLDGIPLAIELAAAKVKLLTPTEIAKRLDDVFKLLTGGARTAVGRQQTMQAAIEWSYDLLAEPEQILLRRLSVFVRSCSYEAAEAVCGDDAFDTLELLERLVDRSMLSTEETDDGQTRFRLQEVVRQFAASKLLASGEADTVRNRTVTWFMKRWHADDPWNIPSLYNEYDEWVLEIDDTLSCVRWALSGGDTEAGLRFAGHLAPGWTHFGRGGEYIDIVRPVVDHQQEATPGLIIACAGLSRALHDLGSRQEADAYACRIQELYSVLDPSPEREGAWFLLTTDRVGRAIWNGELAAAESLLDELEMLGSPWAAFAGVPTINRAHLAIARGNLDEAERLATALLHDQDSRGRALYVLTRISRARGDLVKAIEVTQQAVTEFRAARNGMLSNALVVLATMHQMQGDLIAADYAAAEAEIVARHRADPMALGTVLNNRGYIALARNDDATAVRCFQEAVDVLVGTNHQGEWNARHSLAEAHQHAGRIDNAATIYREALIVADRDGWSALGITTRIDLASALNDPNESPALLAEAVTADTQDSIVVMALWTLAGLRAAVGDPVGAAEVLGASCGLVAIDAEMGIVRVTRRDELRASLEQELGADALAEAEARGAALSRDEMISLLTG